MRFVLTCHQGAVSALVEFGIAPPAKQAQATKCEACGELTAEFWCKICGDLCVQCNDKV